MGWRGKKERLVQERDMNPEHSEAIVSQEEEKEDSIK